MTQNDAHTILRLPEVMAQTGLSRSCVLLYVKQNVFPQPIKLGVRSVGWLKQEINDWVRSQVELSRN